MFGRRKRHNRGDSAAGPLDAPVATIDDETFLASTEGGFTVVDFWAPWCGPCRVFAAGFYETALRHADHVHFARCNVDESPVAATLLQITSIPTVIAFGPDGSELGRIVGIPRQSDLEKTVAELERRAQD